MELTSSDTEDVVGALCKVSKRLERDGVVVRLERSRRVDLLVSRHEMKILRPHGQYTAECRGEGSSREESQCRGRRSH